MWSSISTTPPFSPPHLSECSGQWVALPPQLCRCRVFLLRQLLRAEGFCARQILARAPEFFVGFFSPCVTAISRLVKPLSQANCLTSEPPVEEGHRGLQVFLHVCLAPPWTCPLAISQEISIFILGGPSALPQAQSSVLCRPAVP